MRSLRVTIFLVILAIGAAVVNVPLAIGAIGRLLAAARVGELGTPSSFGDFLILAVIGLSVYLLVMMFMMRAWARNVYIGIVMLAVFYNVVVAGILIPSLIVVAILFFVFYSTWHEFD